MILQNKPLNILNEIPNQFVVTPIDKVNDTHREKLVLKRIHTKIFEMQGWLLLTFFICLHNQLSSFNSIIVQMSEKRDSSNRQ